MDETPEDTKTEQGGAAPPVPAENLAPKYGKKRAVIKALAAVAVASFVIAAVVWYFGRPGKQALTITGTEPSATELVEDARPDTVTITFSGSAAELKNIGKPITKGIAVNPPLSGSWRWRDDRNIVFTPAADWAVAQNYTVNFDKSIFPDHVLLHRYSYSFTTAGFTATLAKTEFYKDPVSPSIKRAIATVKFSHPVNTVDFEGRIKVDLVEYGGEKKPFPFKVTYNKFMGEAYIQSDPAPIPAKDAQMHMAVDPGFKSSRGGNGAPQGITASVTIPGMFTYFRIPAVNLSIVRNDRYEPEQVLVIEASDDVLADEIKKNAQAFILPKDRPAQPGGIKAATNYFWSSAAEIGTEVLKNSSPLNLEYIPGEKDFAGIHSFRYTAEPGRHVYIRLNKGMRSRGGYELAAVVDRIARVPAFPKELKIMHDGALLSMSGSKKLSVVARGIDAVRIEAARVLQSQISHIVTQTQGEFKSPYFNNYSFNRENVSEIFSEEKPLNNAGPAKSQYFAIDLAMRLKAGAHSGKGLFFIKVQSWDIKNKRPTGTEDNRFVLITDLGMVVKRNADNSHDVFVQSVSTGRPVSGAAVEVLGKNGLPVVSAQTDAEGRVKFPRLTDFTREKEPTAFVIRHGEDLSFMPYERYDRNLNVSRFDVGGEYSEGKTDKLNAYLFSDRGIYRPGDEMHVGMLVKHTDWTKGLAGIPVEAVVTDPRGLVVQLKKIKLSPAAFEEISYRTEETSPTGNYEVSVYIVKDGVRAGLLGSTTVRVEEFIPDRMSISVRFVPERLEGWVEPKDLKGTVTLKNLFGIPAADRRVAARITLSPAYPSFREYKDYRFNDPMRAEKSYSENLKDSVTDKDGRAEFPIGLEQFDRATYRIRFTAEGFEAEGGRSVISEGSILVSPLKRIIGYKPDGELGYINKGSARSVDVIALDPQLKKSAFDGLKARVVEYRYISALIKQESGLYQYQSVQKEIPVSEKEFKIPAAGLKYNLSTDRAGDFALIITDAKGAELMKTAFAVVGRGNISRNLEKDAELQIKLDRSDYAPGQEVSVAIIAPYTGAGLITIERERVWAHKWFKTDSTGTVQKIRVPDGLEGNGYINVTFLRAADSKEIFMSPLSYGIQPFTVSRARRDMGIRLDAPDVVRPGERMRIGYKAAKPGKIVIFAVDEGILQVARYRRPDPLGHFFKKRAMEVKTSQILDLLLPEFELLRDAAAAGGGEGAELAKNLNPFKRKALKPAVYWSGIKDVDAVEREVAYSVPDYFNGTLRVMAVAVSDSAVGAAEKTSFVRGHFVLSPNAPSVAVPGDEFYASVAVANNVEGSGGDFEVRLDALGSAHLEIIGEAKKTLKITEGREATAVFNFRARDVLGPASIMFTASGGGKKSSYNSTLSVRPPSPFMTVVKSGQLKSGKADVPVERRMYREFRSLDAAASTAPLVLAGGLLKFLQEYPYGCTEQVVSKAFPALVLRTRPEFGNAAVKAETNFNEALRILRARQNSEGAFGYWAANSYTSDVLTVYAVHFLTEAKEKGEHVPQDLLERGLNALKAMQKKQVSTLADARARAYAIYILTRNGVVTSNYIEPFRKHLNTSFKDVWMKDLTGAYLAGTYMLLKQEGLGDGALGGFKAGESDFVDYDNFYDPLVRDSQYIYIISKHFPERLKKLQAEELLSVVKRLSGSYNTISSSYAILALDAYTAAVGSIKPGSLTISEMTAKAGQKKLVPTSGLFAAANFSPEADKVRFEADSDHYIFYQAAQSGFDLKPPATEIKEGIEVQREYRDAKGSVVTKTTVGSELTVHLKIRSIGTGSVSNVAIVDLLPGGFEVSLDSIKRTGDEAASHASGPDEEDGEEMSDYSRWANVWPHYADIREDRVVVFGPAVPAVKEFVYRIKATNRGRYAVPPAYAEAMYDRAKKARSLGAVIEVVEEIK